MNSIKRITAFSVAVLLFAAPGLSAYAEEAKPADTYVVQYSQVEGMVLNDNLQVANNELAMDILDQEDELKEKYKKISDSIDKTSAALTDILNSSATSPDLKIVAQGTNVALATLSELLNVQEDIDGDTYELKELQAEFSNQQIVRSAQSMFSVYYQLKYNIEQLNHTRSVLNDAYQASQAQYSNQMGTSLAVSDAELAIKSLNNSLADLDNQLNSVCQQMNVMLGLSYNAQVIFGKLPAPDLSYVEKIDLSSDISTAQTASYAVRIIKKQRSILNNDTSQNRKQREIKSNQADLEMENVAASLKNQLGKIKQQQAVLSAEQTKEVNTKLKMEQGKMKYELGLLSQIEYNKLVSDCSAQETTVKTASAILFWQIENYKWILEGLTVS